MRWICTAVGAIKNGQRQRATGGDGASRLPTPRSTHLRRVSHGEDDGERGEGAGREGLHLQYAGADVRGWRTKEEAIVREKKSQATELRVMLQSSN